MKFNKNFKHINNKKRKNIAERIKTKKKLGASLHFRNIINLNHQTWTFLQNTFILTYSYSLKQINYINKIKQQ